MKEKNEVSIHIIFNACQKQKKNYLWMSPRLSEESGMSANSSFVYYVFHIYRKYSYNNNNKKYFFEIII